MDNKNKVSVDDLEYAKEALSDMKEAFDTLDRFFRRVGGITYDRWKSYPKGHIAMAMSDDHGYMGKDMFTVEGLLETVSGESEDEDDEEDEDESYITPLKYPV